MSKLIEFRRGGDSTPITVACVTWLLLEGGWRRSAGIMGVHYRRGHSYSWPPLSSGALQAKTHQKQQEVTFVFVPVLVPSPSPQC